MEQEPMPGYSGTPSVLTEPIASQPPTPFLWRAAIAAAIIALGGLAWALREQIGPRGQALAGVFCFFGLVAMFSVNLRAVNWRTIGWGIALQIILAFLVLKVPFINLCLNEVKKVVVHFIDFSDQGAKFVFGNLADPDSMHNVFAKDFLFPFAFKALPPILFISAFFTMLYHYGILQRVVQVMAKVMVHLMGTSGAETLSVSANVFMGQTEAPLIIKPYVPRMTNSELFVLMASGMAHISGALMVVYISYGADPVAVLTTCIMACPCCLYLSKLFMPEIGKPETAGTVRMHKEKSPYVNGIDAITAGTTDGLKLALNVAAMLIVFIAFVAMFDAVLGAIVPDLSLAKLFGWIFTPAAFLMGVEPHDVSHVASLLGDKLAINEHFAFLQMRTMLPVLDPQTHEVVKAGLMNSRSFALTAFALTGFANFSSVGIQLGGIGAIAPGRRHDLARLGLRALFVGFVATLLNAAVAGIFLS